MISRDSDQSMALRLLDRGLQFGAFRGCNSEVQLAIKLSVSAPEKLQIHKMTRYWGDKYLISFSDREELGGLVIRAIPADATEYVRRAVRESIFLSQVRPEPASCQFPRHLGRFSFQDREVFVTELLPGTPATKTMVGKKEGARVAGAIRYIQHALSVTPAGAATIAEVKNHPDHCKLKVARYLKDYLGINVDQNELSFFERLDEHRRKSPVVVSDRSPANFVFVGERIGAYDFDLVLPGVPFEDWAWFIDDPQLQTSLTRTELLNVFCKDFAQATGEREEELARLFHLAAIFVGIKQCCLLLSMDQTDMACHYLQRGEASAKELAIKEALRVIGKLRRIPRLNPATQKT